MQQIRHIRILGATLVISWLSVIVCHTRWTGDRRLLRVVARQRRWRSAEVVRWFCRLVRIALSAGQNRGLCDAGVHVQPWTASTLR